MHPLLRTQDNFPSINQLSNLFNTFQSAIAGAERVFEILDEQNEVADVPNAISKDRYDGDVEFRNVEFFYQPQKSVLHNISFRAKAGKPLPSLVLPVPGKHLLFSCLTVFMMQNVEE